MRVLVVEDEVDVAANLCDYLEQVGFTVDAAGDGVTGLHLATVNEFDAIVLDIHLPGIDGLTVCQRLREHTDRPTPVLMLTARDTLEDKLAGFDRGADDYLVKPFALSELAARLRVLARRGGGTHGRKELTIADLRLNLDTLAVSRAGEGIKLTRASLKLLELLMRQSHRVVRRAELEYALWRDDPPDSDALRTHIHALRKAIDRPFDRPLLVTVPGIGYRLTDEVDVET